MRWIINFIRGLWPRKRYALLQLSEHHTSNENNGNGPYRSAAIVVGSETFISPAEPASMKSVFQKIGNRIANDREESIRKGLDAPRLRHYFEKVVMHMMLTKPGRTARAFFSDVECPAHLFPTLAVVFAKACEELKIGTIWHHNTDEGGGCIVMNDNELKKLQAFIPTQSLAIEEMAREMLGRS